MHRILISFFCSRQLIKIQKKDSKNGASQQTFGPSYFVRALTYFCIFSAAATFGLQKLFVVISKEQQ